MFSKLLSFSILLFFIGGCAYKNVEIADLSNIPQDPRYFAELLESRTIIDSSITKQSAQKSRELFFAPWREEYGAKDAKVLWGISYIKNRELYGENRLLLSKKDKQEIIDSIDVELFPNSNRNAITVQNTSLRILPTNLPAFYSFYRAGEGFPFDYMQNSTLHIYTPLKVKHITKDGAWAYVESYYVSGFTEIEDIAFVDDAFINLYKNSELFTPLYEDTPLYTTKRHFVEKLKLGALLVKNRDGIVGVERGIDGEGSVVSLHAENLQNYPLEFTSARGGAMLAQLYGEKYGWGGYFDNRDCSAFTKDFFFPFGISLPRNSKAQGYYKKGFIDLSGMSREQKRRYIFENALPFRTIVYLSGHVMLYVGNYDQEPIVMHNMWGVRTRYFGQEGRNIVGRTLISTLTPGGELTYIDKERGFLIDRIRGINIIKE